MPKTPKIATRKTTERKMAKVVDKYFTRSSIDAWHKAILSKKPTLYIPGDYYHSKSKIDIPHRVIPKSTLAASEDGTEFVPNMYRVWELIADTGEDGKLYSTCEKSRDMIFDDKVCLKSSHTLLHISHHDSEHSLARWEMLLVPQYIDFGGLSIVEAWTCGNKFSDVWAYLVVKIPENLEYWPLRKYITSAEDLKNRDYMFTVNNMMLTVPRIKRRMRDSGLNLLLRNLIENKKVNPSSLTPELFGVLVDPNTGNTKRAVLAPLFLRPFSWIPPTFTKIDLEKMRIINLVSIFYPIIAGINKNGETLFKTEDMIEKTLTWLLVGSVGLAAFAWYRAFQRILNSRYIASIVD